MINNLYNILKKAKDKIISKKIALEKNRDIKKHNNNISPLPNIVLRENKNLLFFVPESGVQQHFVSSAIIAKNLKEKGYNVFLVRCFDVFERCPTLSMYNFPIENASKVEKHKICATCINIHKDYSDKYDLDFLDIRHFISSEELQKISKILSNAPEDLRDFEHENIAFGKLTAYEMTLRTKISNFDTNQTEYNRTVWLQLIQTSMVGYIATKNLQKYYAFDILISNHSYVGALGASLAVKKDGIPYLCICNASHINADRSKFRILKSMFWDESPFWKEWYNLSLLPQQIDDIYTDLVNHFVAVGSHQYSPAANFGTNKDLVEYLNLPKNRKILVAYNSSEDEILGYNYLASVLNLPLINESHNIFEDQLTWLKEICEFAENNDEYYLIIRLHPRLGKNKRENRISTHYEELKQLLDKTFSNVKIIWPEEQISSYRLFDFMDLALFSWSSVSMDVGRLGIPSLSYTKRIPGIPTDDLEGDFINIAKNKKDYFEKIKQLTQEKPTIKRASSAMRWYNMFNLASSIDMSDICEKLQNDLPDFVLSREADLIEKVVIGKTSIVEENCRRQNAVQTPNSEIEEYKSIQKVLRKFIHFNIIGDTLQEKDIILQFIETNDIENVIIEDRYNSFKSFLITNGTQVRYIYVGKDYYYYSPLCANLAKICHSYI